MARDEKEIGKRVQELYDIKLKNLTRENIDELQALEREAKKRGYERTDQGDINAIRYGKGLTDIRRWFVGREEDKSE